MSKKSIFASIVLCFVLLSANAASLSDPNKTTGIEIKEYLDQYIASASIVKERTLVINFMLNNENELVIVSTSDKSYDSLIKSSLNYKKIKSKRLEQYKPYNLRVRLKK